jgi:hypothetical protein
VLAVCLALPGVVRGRPGSSFGTALYRSGVVPCCCQPVGITPLHLRPGTRGLTSHARHTVSPSAEPRRGCGFRKLAVAAGSRRRTSAKVLGRDLAVAQRNPNYVQASTVRVQPPPRAADTEDPRLAGRGSSAHRFPACLSSDVSQQLQNPDVITVLHSAMVHQGQPAQRRTAPFIPQAHWPEPATGHQAPCRGRLGPSRIWIPRALASGGCRPWCAKGGWTPSSS